MWVADYIIYTFHVIILKHFAVGLVTQVILALIAISTLTPCLQNKTKKSGSFGSILKSEKLKKKNGVLQQVLLWWYNSSSFY